MQKLDFHPQHKRNLLFYHLNSISFNWNVLNCNFTFPVPGYFPKKYDTAIGSPLLPLGREVIINLSGNVKPHNVDKQKLPMIEMPIEWLKEAIVFPH